MANTAEAPLLSHQEDELEDDQGSEVANAEDTGTEWPAGRPGLFIWLLTLSAGISGLLFGCECGTLRRLVWLLTFWKMTQG